MVFEDSIQRIEGMKEPMAMRGRLADRCKQIRFDIHSVARSGNVFFLQWTMTMVFDRFPSPECTGAPG